MCGGGALAAAVQLSPGVAKSRSLCLQDDLKLQHFLWQAWNIDRDIAAAEEEHKAQEGALKVATRLGVEVMCGTASDMQVLTCNSAALAAQPSFWLYRCIWTTLSQTARRTML